MNLFTLTLIIKNNPRLIFVGFHRSIAFYVLSDITADGKESQNSRQAFLIILAANVVALFFAFTVA